MDPIDITAAVHKKGLTLVKISRDAGLSTSACGHAIKHPSRRAEEVIAKAIGKPLQAIWPDRYDATGRRRIRTRARRTVGADFCARGALGGQ